MPRDPDVSLSDEHGNQFLSSELESFGSPLLLNPSTPQFTPQSMPNPSSSPAGGSSSFLEKAALRVGTKSNAVVDPDSILKWITVIREVLAMCPRNAQQLKTAGQEQRLLQRRTLVLAIGRNFPNISRNEALIRARHMFEVAANASVEEIQSTLDEVRS